MEFKDWFFREFPDVYQESDVNKNNVGEGTWQRYLKTFGLELDEEIMPYINSFVNIIDIEKCDDKFLPLIAGILGSPPSIGTDSLNYRKLLSQIIAIYKVKGTKVSYELLFGILSFNISIISDIPIKKTTYDIEPVEFYDDGHIYDSECSYCTDYRIGWFKEIPDAPALAAALVDLELLEGVICFIQPINAKFAGFIRMLKFYDDYQVGGLVVDNTNIQLI